MAIWLPSLSMKITLTHLLYLTEEKYDWERSQIYSVFCLQKQKRKLPRHLMLKY